MNNPLTYGEWLAIQLHEHGKTHQQFAADLGVAETTISRWINNHHTPNKLTQNAIENLLTIYESTRTANPQPKEDQP